MIRTTTEYRRVATVPSRLLAAAWLSATISGCGSPPQPEEPTQAPQKPLTVETLLPLEDGTVSSFVTTNDANETGMFVLEIERPRPELAHLSIAGQIQRVHVEPHGRSLAQGGYLLREPLEQGATFAGAFGTVTLSQVDHSFEVPAGTFQRCVTTVEESTRPPKRSTSVYCDGVGLVALIVEGSGQADVLRMEARLKSHGPRVDLDELSADSALRDADDSATSR